MSVIQETIEIARNDRLARDTYLLRLNSPTLARLIKPGQFLMLRLTGPNDPLLGRPFALYDTVLDPSGSPTAVDIVYLVVGKVTTAMSRLQPGQTVSIWGPLGNGFRRFEKTQHVALVAGGIGQTPFLAYIRELLGSRGYGGSKASQSAARVSLYYGVRTAELAAGVDDFRAAGAAVHLASNDGSLGFCGVVTDLLKSHSRPDRLIGCGPEPMLRALACLAEERNIPCDVSLETPMACGLGICFSCVTKVKTANGWDYKRVCVDGPVFDSACLNWED